MERSHSPLPNAAEAIRIRQSSLEDGDEVAALFVDQEGGTREEHRAGFEKEITANHPDNLLLVAEADGCIVGFARARRFRHPPEPPGNVAPEGWYLLGVIVAPAFRRRGIAARLTRCRLEWIAERADEAWFFTEVMNHASIALHERFGFVAVSRDFCFPKRSSSEPGVLFRLPLRGPKSRDTSGLHTTSCVTRQLGSKP
jgi:ribosomal protein S18 acetylase RimI-like enzyme